MMRLILSIAIVITLLMSCKKDRLDGDKSVLIGEWKWVSTEHITYDPWTSNDTTILTPSSVGNDYYLEFIQKGKLIFKNNNDSRKDRIVFAKYAGSSIYPGYDYFGLFLNNDHHFVFQGVVKTDSLIVYHNPILDYQVSDTASSISYFIRN